MLKYWKRKHVSEKEDSENGSQLSQPSTSKGKVSDDKKKKSPLL